MTANNAWQYQGRQQHGWFGSGTGPHGIHPTAAGPSLEPLPSPRDYPTVSTDRSDGIRPVYPLEYLLGALTGGSLARAAISALVRNLGSTPRQASREPSLPEVTLHQGKQDKHIVGTNNYQPGKSVLLADPRALLRQFAGRGEPMNGFPPGAAGYKERFDTGDRIIGIWKSEDGSQMAERHEA